MKEVLELITKTREDMSYASLIKEAIKEDLETIEAIVSSKIKTEAARTEVYELFTVLLSGSYRTIPSEKIGEILAPSFWDGEEVHIIGLYVEPDSLIIKKETSFFNDEEGCLTLVPNKGLVFFLHQGEGYLIENPVTGLKEMEASLLKTIEIKHKVREFINSL